MSLNNSINSVKSKRGRKKIEDQWSRVISISADDLEEVRVYELAPDMLLSSAVRATLSRGKKALAWKPLFNPDEYAKSTRDMTVAGNQLTVDQLQQYGVKVTAGRKIQRDRAAAVNNDNKVIDGEAYLRSAKKLAERMHMGYFQPPKIPNIYMMPKLKQRHPG